MNYPGITPNDYENDDEKNGKYNFEDNMESIIFKDCQCYTDYLEIISKDNKFIKIVFRTAGEINSKVSDVFEINKEKLNSFKEVILIIDFQILSIELDAEELKKLISKLYNSIESLDNTTFSLIIKNCYIDPEKGLKQLVFPNKLILNKLEISDELYSLSSNLILPDVEVNELILKKFKFNSKTQLLNFCEFIIKVGCKKLTLEDIFIDLIIKKDENDNEYKDLDIYLSYIDGVISIDNTYTTIYSLTLRDCPLFAIIGNMFTYKNPHEYKITYKDIDIDETSLINPSIITKFKIHNGKYDICFDLDSYKLQLEENEDNENEYEYDFIDYLDFIFNIIIKFERKEQKIKISKDEDGIGEIDRDHFHKLTFKNFDVTKFEYITDDDMTFIEEENWILNETERKRKERWEKLEEDLNKFEYQNLLNVKELVFDNCSNFFIKWIINFVKGKNYENKSYNYDFDLLKIKKCGKDYVNLDKILIMKINKLILFDNPLIIGNSFPEKNSHLDNVFGKLGSIDNLTIKINSLETYGREYNLRTYKTYEILIELIKCNKFNKNLTFELNALSSIMTFLAYKEYLRDQNFYNNANEDEEGDDDIKNKEYLEGIMKDKDIIKNNEKFLPKNIFFSSKKKRDNIYFKCFNLGIFDNNSKITLNNLTIKKTTENFDNQNYYMKIKDPNSNSYTLNNQLKKIDFGSDGFYIDRDYKYFFSKNNIGTVELTNVIFSNYKDNNLKEYEKETIITLLSDNSYEKNSISINKYGDTHFPNYIIDVKTLNCLLFKNNLFEDVGILFRYFMYKIDPQIENQNKPSQTSPESIEKKNSLNTYFNMFKEVFKIFSDYKQLTIKVNNIKELKELYCTLSILKVILTSNWIKEKVFLNNNKDKIIDIELPSKNLIEREIGSYFLKEKNEEEKEVYAEMNYYYTSFEEKRMIEKKIFEIKKPNYKYNIQCDVDFYTEI